MAQHIQDGKYGEQRAVVFLKEQGYEILALNWRYKYNEVDIIAKDLGILVFVEVKSRHSAAFGDPASFVDIRKQGNLIRAADAYLELSGFEGEIRFDIVSVMLSPPMTIELIKDAFWSS